MLPIPPLIRWSLLAGLALSLAACGGGDKKETAEFPDYDNTEEVQAYYEENSDFFVEASLDDLPADLEWKDGMEYADLGSPDAKKGGTWHQYEPDYPRTLRRIGPDANGSFRFWQTDVDVTFAKRHPNEEAADAYFPGVAKEWAFDPDTATVYMRIDPDAKFSDGHPITVEDVFFLFYFNRAEYSQAPWYQNFYVEFYKNVTRYDDLTFSITMAKKRPDYHQYALLLSPSPRHFYYEYGEDFVQRYQWRFEPTTGPYVIKEEDIKKGKSIALTRNPDWWAKDKKYWRNRFNFDRIEFSIIRDPEKAFETFMAGQLDVASLNQAKRWFDQLPDDHRLVKNGYVDKVLFYNKVPQGGFNFWFNTNRPLLDNVDIRTGLTYATNWDLVLDQVFRGTWARMHTTGRGYGEADHPTLKSRNFDPKAARESFAKAGFKEKGADGILVNDQGQRLSFTVTTGYKTLEDHLTVIVQEARKAGVELKLEVLDPSTAWKKTQEKKHEITLTGFSFSPDEIYPRYWETYHGENAFEEDGSVKTQTNNLVMVNDPVLDALIIEYRRSEDHEEKVKLAHEIEEILYDQALHSYGFYPPSYRVGYWRWIKWPEDFNVMRSEYYFSWMVHWFDEEAKAETEKAMKEGETFPPVVKTFDQHKSE